MKFYEINPSEKLLKYVKQYWAMEIDNNDNSVCERVIPTPNVDIMFHYRNSFNVKQNTGLEYKQPQSFVSGIKSNYADVTTSGETGLICVVFYPHSAHRFFNFPLSELRNQVVNLDNIFTIHIKYIEEQLGEAKNLQQRIKIIEDFLLANLNTSYHKDDILLFKSLQLINQTKGQIKVAELSKELYTSPKSLERKFTAIIGKTPKQFLKIIRFQHIIQSMFHPQTNLTDVAYVNGYFDQAHFIKDFKAFTGCTPKQYINNDNCSAIDS